MEISGEPSKPQIDPFGREIEDRNTKLIEPIVEQDVVDGATVLPSDQGSASLTSARSDRTPRRLFSIYNRIPYLRKVPPFVTFPIAILVLVNLLVWTIVGIILSYHP